MYIPPKHHMPVLEDPVAYYYIPVFRSFFVKRLKLCLDLLPEGHIPRILDIGCGTGIILPELARRTGGEICAMDNLLQDRSLRGMMELEGISAHLATADLLHLPYASDSFEAVLAISVLEHIEALAEACGEIHRVLKPGGIVVAGFPTKNVITDKLLGESIGFHVSSHRQILDAMKKVFTSFKVTHFPAILPLDLSLYTACSGVKPV
ncbi:MAG TPA: class I SAM-dependent methyltransferase [Bacteroidetes bacterium]|nr:class I SAM-dependent methyltransferase [Bacteroidota bacterium]